MYLSSRHNTRRGDVHLNFMTLYLCRLWETRSRRSDRRQPLPKKPISVAHPLHLLTSTAFTLTVMSTNRPDSSATLSMPHSFSETTVGAMIITGAPSTAVAGDEPISSASRKRRASPPLEDGGSPQKRVKIDSGDLRLSRDQAIVDGRALVDELALELQCACCAATLYRPVISRPCEHFFCGRYAAYRFPYLLLLTDLRTLPQLRRAMDSGGQPISLPYLRVDRQTDYRICPFRTAGAIVQLAGASPPPAHHHAHSSKCLLFC
jgi:hypothetical protein